MDEYKTISDKSFNLIFKFYNQLISKNFNFFHKDFDPNYELIQDI